MEPLGHGLIPGSGAQIIYLSHGGGPLPILGDAGHEALVYFLKQLPTRIRKPEAILVVSAHWEEEVATLLGSGAPPMLYDYHGFPEAAYRMSYRAPGSPALAEKIAGLLATRGIPSRIDSDRGYDHGHFVPLKLIYPDADIPSTQLSLIRGLDPALHAGVGEALRDLLNENILVIGSGFSFHNLAAFSWRGDGEPDPGNDAFQDWLVDLCTAPHSQDERLRGLVNWEGAPFARYCHPREEHLLPLHVCAGMAGKSGDLVFDDLILGKRAVGFLW